MLILSLIFTGAIALVGLFGGVPTGVSDLWFNVHVLDELLYPVVYLVDAFFDKLETMDSGTFLPFNMLRLPPSLPAVPDTLLEIHIMASTPTESYPSISANLITTYTAAANQHFFVTICIAGLSLSVATTLVSMLVTIIRDRLQHGQEGLKHDSKKVAHTEHNSASILSQSIIPLMPSEEPAPRRISSSNSLELFGFPSSSFDLPLPAAAACANTVLISVESVLAGLGSDKSEITAMAFSADSSATRGNASDAVGTSSPTTADIPLAAAVEEQPVPSFAALLPPIVDELLVPVVDEQSVSTAQAMPPASAELTHAVEASVGETDSSSVGLSPSSLPDLVSSPRPSNQSETPMTPSGVRRSRRAGARVHVRQSRAIEKCFSELQELPFQMEAEPSALPSPVVIPPSPVSIALSPLQALIALIPLAVRSIPSPSVRAVIEPVGVSGPFSPPRLPEPSSRSPLLSMSRLSGLRASLWAPSPEDGPTPSPAPNATVIGPDFSPGDHRHPLASSKADRSSWWTTSASPAPRVSRWEGSSDSSSSSRTRYPGLAGLKVGGYMGRLAELWSTRAEDTCTSASSQTAAGS
ncbi:hypothetical protein BKA93DRAFT_70029 [Sparassis latifolia]|uniref:Uncharacterized protein n=1 Tax=Sparassis crispa TaxID=139825 RepID=A0A401GER6_9APHY|nr:hypothetical protein SCP_0303080 [Sparassis crispa]GBE80593.1 hypothetical protein SCP_0303080 [Sparassis crispa]